MMKNFLPVNENSAVETQLPDWRLAVHKKTLPSPLRHLTMRRVEKIIVSLSMNSELAGRKCLLSVAPMHRWPQLLHLQVQRQEPIGTKNENHLQEV
jgi:hypothetical protein